MNPPNPIKITSGNQQLQSATHILLLILLNSLTNPISKASVNCFPKYSIENNFQDQHQSLPFAIDKTLSSSSNFMDIGPEVAPKPSYHPDQFSQGSYHLVASDIPNQQLLRRIIQLFEMLRDIKIDDKKDKRDQVKKPLVVQNKISIVVGCIQPNINSESIQVTVSENNALNFQRIHPTQWNVQVKKDSNRIVSKEFQKEIRTTFRTNTTSIRDVHKQMSTTHSFHQKWNHHHHHYEGNSVTSQRLELPPYLTKKLRDFYSLLNQKVSEIVTDVTASLGPFYCIPSRVVVKTRNSSTQNINGMKRRAVMINRKKKAKMQIQGKQSTAVGQHLERHPVLWHSESEWRSYDVYFKETPLFLNMKKIIRNLDTRSTSFHNNAEIDEPPVHYRYGDSSPIAPVLRK